MKPEERRNRIAELVRQSGRVAVEELAETLGTSRETVRRDLTLLSNQGALRKVHGGATTAQTASESPLAERRAQARTEKMMIGRTAAALFKSGDSLLIDSGTTTIFFAEQLALRGPFTVITNSTLVAQELWASPQRGNIHLLGGSYFGDGYEILGPQVVEQIQKVHADHAVLTVGAVDPAGRIMDFNGDEAYVARAMIASAREVTVLADASKLGRHALFQVCGPESVDRLITNKTPDPILGNVLKASGVEVIIAASDPQ